MTLSLKQNERRNAAFVGLLAFSIFFGAVRMPHADGEEWIQPIVSLIAASALCLIMFIITLLWLKLKHSILPQKIRDDGAWRLSKKLTDEINYAPSTLKLHLKLITIYGFIKLTSFIYTAWIFKDYLMASGIDMGIAATQGIVYLTLTLTASLLYKTRKTNLMRIVFFCVATSFLYDMYARIFLLNTSYMIAASILILYIAQRLKRLSNL